MASKLLRLLEDATIASYLKGLGEEKVQKLLLDNYNYQSENSQEKLQLDFIS